MCAISIVRSAIMVACFSCWWVPIAGTRVSAVTCRHVIGVKFEEILDVGRDTNQKFCDASQSGTDAKCYDLTPYMQFWL